jgi:hypothetical protein
MDRFRLRSCLADPDDQASDPVCPAVRDKDGMRMLSFRILKVKKAPSPAGAFFRIP